MPTSGVCSPPPPLLTGADAAEPLTHSHPGDVAHRIGADLGGRLDLAAVWREADAIVMMGINGRFGGTLDAWATLPIAFAPHPGVYGRGT